MMQQSGTGVGAFSADIKDLYYSLPHKELLKCAEESIDNFELVRFENMVGVSSKCGFAQ